MIQSSDRVRVAAAIRVNGELTEVHLDAALELFGEWEKGAKTANLDPTRSNPWDADNECFVPNDPTGEQAMHARADFAAEFHMRLERCTNDSLWLRDAYHVLAPIVPPSTMNEKQDLWCDNHLRIGLAEVRHRGDECRSCYDFRLQWKVRQPVSLMRDRHQGKRITEQMVKAALEADGMILETVAGVTKAVRKARGSTGSPNQNTKRSKAS